ncbi:MAG: glycosyltransferase family 8 protein [Bryobacteraceae bacterium]
MRIPIVFCADVHALGGLQLTLYTLAKHIGPADELAIIVVYEGLQSDHFKSIESVLAATLDQQRYTFTYIPVNTAQFRALPWQGGRMTYVRLILPDIIDEPRFIYMDADLMVLCDVGTLFRHEIAPSAVGACSWSPASESNDRDFFARHALPKESPYFNAGVLVIDALKWRALGVSDKVRNVSQHNSWDFPSRDQTILNVCFLNTFHLLPRRYNTPVSADRPRLSSDDLRDRIVHLVGHPKPWERFGWLNGQYIHYRRLCSEMQARRIKIIPDRTPLVRCLRWSRAYAKCVVGQIKSTYAR